MGKWLSNFLSSEGLETAGGDAVDKTVTPELVSSSDVLVIAAPIKAIDKVMASIGPYTNPKGVVIDIASVKEHPLRSLLTYSRGEVIGAHPLFGPSASSLHDQVVFLCRGRGEKWFPTVEKFLTGLGANTIEIDPVEHDRLMAVIQSLRHIMLVCFGQTLKDIGFSLSNDLPNSGQWFNTLVQLLMQQLKQPASLYADLALENPFADEAIQVFTGNSKKFAQALRSKDREALLRTIQDVDEYLKNQEIFP